METRCARHVILWCGMRRWRDYRMVCGLRSRGAERCALARCSLSFGASISDKHARRRRPIGIAVCFSFVSSISYFRRFYQVKNQSPSRSTADGSSHPPRRPARRPRHPAAATGRQTPEHRGGAAMLFLTTARRDIWASPYVRRGSALVGERHHAQAKYRRRPQANMDAHNPASPAAGGASFEMPRPGRRRMRPRRPRASPVFSACQGAG